MVQIYDVAAAQRTPNYGAALTQGLTTGRALRESVLREQQAKQEMQQQSALGELSPRIAQGDNKALQRALSIDPTGAGFKGAMDMRESALSLEDERDAKFAEFMGKAGKALTFADEEKRPQLYDAFQNRAIQMGYMTPEEAEPYSPKVMDELQAFMYQAEDIGDIGQEVDTSEREKRINRIMSQGADRRTATGIVDGYIKTATDPVFGGTRRIDLLTGEAIPFEEGVSQDYQPSVKTSNRGGLYQRAELSTGPESSIKSMAGKVQGLLMGDISPSTDAAIQARDELKLANRDLIRSLTVNPRFAVTEIERIRKDTNIEPKFFTSPSELKSKFKVMDSYLRDQMNKALQDSRDDRLPVKTRQDQASNASYIAQYLDIINVPDNNIPSGDGDVVDYREFFQ